MAVTVTITLQAPESLNDMNEILRATSGDEKAKQNALATYFGALASGNRSAQMSIDVSEGEAQTPPSST